MRRGKRYWCSALLAAACAVSAGCGGARPYRAMARAASSEESASAQAEDLRLKASLREALLAADPQSLGHVTPYAYMGHVYLVGFVDDAAQRQTLIGAAGHVPGVVSVNTYLPGHPAESETARDLETKAEVKSALAVSGDRVTQIDLEVLAGHVVLLGVVDNQQAINTAAAAAQSVSAVNGVTNFLLLPEAEYEKRLRLLR